MSVKAMALVWEMPCPSKVNEIEFKPGHKYVLLAYADHADQFGKNIYPAIFTIHKKTGYDERSIQRLTRELQQMGILIPDGDGPRGTNRWMLPFSKRGDKISPLTKYQGDKSDETLGDIPSGDIPSGDILSPEFNNLNREIYNYEKYWIATKDLIKSDRNLYRRFYSKIKDTNATGLDDDVLFVNVQNKEEAEYLEDRLRKIAERMLVGIAGQEISVRFVIV